MEERAQPGRAIVPRPGPSEWGFVSSPAATVHAPSMDFGSHVPLAVLTGRLCAAVEMCECVCDGTERSGDKPFVSQHTGKHTNMWLNVGPYLSFQSRAFSCQGASRTTE